MAERKSWREIDRERDRGRSSSEPRGPARNIRVDTATAEYKRQLNAFFDRGIVPESLKGKIQPSSEPKDPHSRTALLRAVREAENGKALEKAIDELRTLGPLPDEPEILLRALEHRDDKVLLEVIEILEKIQESGQKIPKKALFIQRLKGLEFSSFDPRVQTRAPALAARLS